MMPRPWLIGRACLGRGEVWGTGRFSTLPRTWVRGGDMVSRTSARRGRAFAMTEAIRGRVGCTYLSRLRTRGGAPGPAHRTPRARHRQQPPARSLHGLRRGLRGRAVGRRAGVGARRRARRRGLDRLAGTVVPESLQPEVADRLRGGQPRAGVPLRRRGGGLLRPRLQRHAVAAAPLLRRPPQAHARSVAAVRTGERAVRGRRHRAVRPRLARMGPRLPPDAPAGDAAPAGARTSRSASSCTRPSRPPRSTASCRRARRFSAGSSARTT